MRNLTDNRPLVSFVILSWNTQEDTLLCINNVKQQKYAKKEIIVVDNGSVDGSKNALQDISDITYIDLPKNLGFTGGQIEALKHCNGEYVALINSDAVLDEQWAEICVTTFQEKMHSKVAVVGGRAYTWENEKDPFNPTVPFYAYQSVDPTYGYATTHTTGDMELEVDSISGAAVMIKMSVVKTIGYFDNNFFAYYEETDLFARFQRAGYKILYQPRAHAWHQIGKSTHSKPFFYLYHMQRNRFQFAYKNLDDASMLRKRYFKDGWLATKLYFLDERSLDNKAKMLAYWWIVLNFPRLAHSRKKTQLLGPTYTKKVHTRPVPSDVTIIIPSYNYGRFITSTIRSCLKQSHPATKIIVIDDGSTDDSVEIARKFKNITVISKSNEGVVKTKNLGIELSQSTWTLFVDADDTIPPNYLEELMKAVKKNNYDVVYSDAEYFGAQKGRQVAGDYSFDRLKNGNFIHNSALMRTAMLKNNPYKTEMSLGYEDWELYLSLAEKGYDFIYTTKTALKYRQHRSGVGRNIGAITRAELLFSTVRRLHPSIYLPAQAPPALPANEKIRTQITHHPSLVVAVPVLLMISVITSIFDYARMVKSNTVRYVRTYIHWRNS